MPVTILFLSANPADTRAIDVEDEARTIQGVLRNNKRFDVKLAPAARVDDFQTWLLELPRPLLVHFGGHGVRGGIAGARGSIDGPRPSASPPGVLLVRDDEGRAAWVAPGALARLFELLGGVSCVVLNACFSEAQAEMLAAHVDYVIGTSGAIGDGAALAFSKAFYEALGAGRPLKTSFELGRNAIALKGLGDPEVVRDFYREGVKPEEIRLAEVGEAPAPFLVPFFQNPGLVGRAGANHVQLPSPDQRHEGARYLIRTRLPHILASCARDPHPVLIRAGVPTTACPSGSALDQWTYLCEWLGTTGLPGIVATIQIVRELQGKGTTFSEDLSRWSAAFTEALSRDVPGGDRDPGKLASHLARLAGEESRRWEMLHSVCLDLVASAADGPGVDQPGVTIGGPAGDRIGCYRIVHALGSGGMGVVFRATHVETGIVVALKTVRVAESRATASITREIRVLNTIRHPGVVRILDQGIEGGCLWYAMELIEGQPFDHHLRALHSSRGADAQTGALTMDTTVTQSLQTEPAPPLLTETLNSDSDTGPPAPMPELDTTLGVLHRLAMTLSFLHGKGFVHCDLKPSNIVVQAGGAPILVDFGLALEGAGSGREVLETRNSVAGTVSYMAPEQIRGENVDPRTDLYSLGCILYEAVTGCVPFAGGAFVEVLRQHLSAAPVAPSRIRAGVPPRLERLILRLLAKDRRERPGFAEDVAAELADLSLGFTPDAPVGRPQPYAYRPRLFGREGLIESFDKILDRAREGAGTRVYIAGESGVGKTRLMGEVARRAMELGFRVVGSRGAETSAERVRPLHPFRPLLRAIADACGDDGGERAQRLVGSRGRILAAYEPRFAGLPGQYTADPSDPSAPAGVGRLLRCLRDTLAAFADEGPLLLLLDDLQWADELSLGFLESLTAELFEEHPVLVLAAYRAEESSNAIDRLIDAPGAKRILLDRLSPPAMHAMIADMLSSNDVPEPLGELLAKHSDGNPFFVAELVRAAIAEGRLGRETRGGWHLVSPATLPTPATLAELVHRRLAALSPEARQVLEAASVLGRECDVTSLLAVAEVDESSALPGIKELIKCCVFDELPAGGLRFAHEKLREAAHAGMRPERRRDLQLRAARAIK
jgi:serine/threonine protein kinase